MVQILELELAAEGFHPQQVVFNGSFCLLPATTYDYQRDHYLVFV